LENYSHLPPELVDEKRRRSAILSWLGDFSPDLILLQEVDLLKYEDDFAKPLGACGYNGMLQKRDKHMGCATFWRKSIFSQTWADPRSRTLPLGLKMCKFDEHPIDIAVVNVHLDAAQDKQADRAKQLSSALERAAKNSPTSILIVAGDFNCNPDNSLAQVLRSHKWHGFSLASVYDHPAASDTSPVTEATAAVNRYRDLFDHIWYSHNSLRLCGMLQSLNREERTISFSTDSPGLPNAVVPSDHIPIGAIFSLKRDAFLEH
jgi:mRNA deadenylase 3'-5' endonuclease subunit Ccr4